jgi:hypothetical protein
MAGGKYVVFMAGGKYVVIMAGGKYVVFMAGGKHLILSFPVCRLLSVNLPEPLIFLHFLPFLLILF